MTFIDNQLKGNWGEQYIASHITACGCLVRHVQQGHDSGIDLYCESIKHENPFLHFFVQVKTSNDYKKDQDKVEFSLGVSQDGDANEENKIKTKEKIEYLKKQPVPIFIFLVPDERGEGTTPFFICSVLDFKDNKVKSCMKINNPEELKDNFFGENKKFSGLLIKETFRWSLSKGHVSPLSNSVESRLSWFPEEIMDKTPYLNKITDTLHNALWRISEDLLKNVLHIEEDKLELKDLNKVKQYLSEIEPYLKALESITDKNDSSNVSRVTIGLWYFAKGDIDLAKTWIEKGISIAKAIIDESQDQDTIEHVKKQLRQTEKYLDLITVKQKCKVKT